MHGHQSWRDSTPCRAKQMTRLFRNVVLSAACVAILFAQSLRDSYRAAYAQWRQSEPNLERDAGSPQQGFAQRVEKVAQTAADYGKARASFLRDSARQDLGPLTEPFKPELELLPHRDL